MLSWSYCQDHGEVKFFNFSEANETKDLEGIGSSFLTAYDSLCLAGGSYADHACCACRQLEIDSSFPDLAGTQNTEVPRTALTSLVWMRIVVSAKHRS